jgi:dipeptide/tripeptide permease
MSEINTMQTIPLSQADFLTSANRKEVSAKLEVTVESAVSSPIDVERNNLTAGEIQTRRNVTGPIPCIAFWFYSITWALYASFYAIKPLIGNYVNRPFPEFPNGNGYGAPTKGSNHTAGALGLGTVIATLVAQSFYLLVNVLPLFFGWLADSRTGRWNLLFWGVLVAAVGHSILVAAGAPTLLANGKAIAPFMSGIYIIGIGSCTKKYIELQEFS